MPVRLPLRSSSRSKSFRSISRQCCQFFSPNFFIRMSLNYPALLPANRILIRVKRRLKCGLKTFFSLHLVSTEPWIPQIKMLLNKVFRSPQFFFIGHEIVMGDGNCVPDADFDQILSPALLNRHLLGKVHDWGHLFHHVDLNAWKVCRHLHDWNKI